VLVGVVAGLNDELEGGFEHVAAEAAAAAVEEVAGEDWLAAEPDEPALFEGEAAEASAELEPAEEQDRPIVEQSSEEEEPEDGDDEDAERQFEAVSSRIACVRACVRACASVVNECCWQAEPTSKQALKAQKKAAKQEVCAQTNCWLAARLTTALLAQAKQAKKGAKQDAKQAKKDAKEAKKAEKAQRKAAKKGK